MLNIFYHPKSKTSPITNENNKTNAGKITHQIEILFYCLFYNDHQDTNNFPCNTFFEIYWWWVVFLLRQIKRKGLKPVWRKLHGPTKITPT